MTLLSSWLTSALLARAALRKRYPRHFRPPGSKRVACAKPGARKATSQRELVTCEPCRAAMLIAGVLHVVA